MSERPATGIGHYLRDLVFGASDGVVTTLAIVAGVAGARLATWVAIVLGIANLVADGLSMAVGNYLGLESELEQTGRSVAREQPWRHAAATFAAFIVVGAVPLLGFAIGVPGISRSTIAIVLGLAALAIVGAYRSRFMQRPAWRCSLEMVALAGGACAAAYAVGAALEPLLGV